MSEIEHYMQRLAQERALVDEAAKVFAMPPGPRRIEAEEWWLARYRQARGL